MQYWQALAADLSQIPVSFRTMNLFNYLGFQWDRASLASIQLPTHTRERVAFRFHRMLPEFVWDASVLEGNPFTFPEVKTLLDGVTVGGRKLSDQEQVLNLAISSRRLLALVKAGKFVLDKTTFTDLHALVARHEADFQAPELNRVFFQGVQVLQEEVNQPFEQAAAFFLFGALQQFFFDGNKRTSRFMMNGILMGAGIDAISIPAAKAQQFNENMVRFYLDKEATEMMHFLLACHPSVAA